MYLLMVFALAASATVYGDPIPMGTPAARYWEEALPDSPLPQAIKTAIARVAHMPPLVPREASFSLNCFGSYKDGHKGCSDLVATTGLFFHESDVHVGNRTTLSSPPVAPEMAILPRKVADEIPFVENNSSIGNLTDVVLQMFHIVPGSPAAADVKETLHVCLEPTVDKKRHMLPACATSLESVIELAMRMLGTRNIQAAASALPGAGLPRQAYIVHAVSPLSGSLRVICHRQPYPYGVYYCHSIRLSKAYKMSIISQAGGAIDMVAVCHEDTSDWNPNHPAFKALRTQPGGSPVCHCVPYGDLVFGEKGTN